MSDTFEKLLMARLFGENKPNNKEKKYWVCPYCGVVIPKYGNLEGKFKQKIKNHLFKAHSKPQ